MADHAATTHASPPHTSPPHTGTTIVAVEYDGGVVLGADSRVSTGTYVSNRASDKITPLSDGIYLLRSGSAADTQAVSDYVRYFAEQHEQQLQFKSDEPVKVHTVANLVKMMNYQNKHLVGAMIVAGWDPVEKGQVYGCPIGGTIVREKWTIDGSGSTFIWGYMDSKYEDGMTKEDAESLVLHALALAMAKDGSSGGVVRLVTIDEDGASRRMVTENDAEFPAVGKDSGLQHAMEMMRTYGVRV
jgi:20S proteasome subunit beta 1